MPHSYPAECVFKTLNDIENARITVMGLGLNGGGTAAALFLARHGAYVTITDMKTEVELAPSVELIKNTPDIDLSRISFVLGRHEVRDFTNADCVIKNPGVKYEGNVYLAEAKHIETDLSLFLRFTKAPIIAVTGSKGKSSTVSAIHFGLEQAGFTTFLGGNITVSPLTFFDKTTDKTPVVLELSSWQLADLRGRGVLKPHIAVLTTIVPDHQNWYGAMEPYVADKKLIFADQSSTDYTLCKYNDEWGSVFAHETKGKIFWYATSIVDSIQKQDTIFAAKTAGFAWLNTSGEGFISDGNSWPLNIKTSCQIVPENVSVPGFHMKENLLKAGAVMHIMGVTAVVTKDILGRYTGIPHRLEFFHQWKPVASETPYLFYNDSAATVPEATIAALHSFTKPVILLCGGTDKKCDFKILASALKEASSFSHLHDMYLLSGSGTDQLISLLSEELAAKKQYNSLRELLIALKESLFTQNTISPEIRPVIVFSPGATSFGMFNNEFDRGNKFKQMVQEIFT